MVEAELAEAKAALEGSKAVNMRRRWMFCYPCNAVIFTACSEAMDGLPVIIRLIDPPLHEFLPSQEDLLVDVTTMLKKAKRWFEEKEIYWMPSTDCMKVTR